MMYLLFILGLFVGSFLNVVILRLEKGEGGILAGRSHCPKCGVRLQWFELIPLVSFLIQGGKCRSCKKPISFQYPLVEFFTGLLFSFLYWRFGLTLQFGFLAVVSSLLVILFVSDLRTQMIPDIVAYIGIGLAFLYALISPPLFHSFTSSLIGAAISGGFFALLVYPSREKWMGKGDVKIGVLTGLLLGYPQVLVALFLSFTLGAFVGLILIATKKKTLKSQVPFGPFLITATFVTIFLGEKILEWYLGII
jgi:leader peptidase (prepilin peptidase)/N-methyltransferase